MKKNDEYISQSPNSSHFVMSDESVDDFLVRLNIKRAMLISAIAVVMQTANLFGDCIQKYMFMRIGIIVSLALGVISLVFGAVFIKKSMLSTQKLYILIIAYWILFALQMTPFVYLDGKETGTPINTLLFFLPLVVAPQFRPKLMFSLFTPMFVYMMSVLFLSGAQTHLMLIGGVIGTACIVIAYSIQSSFVNMLDRLHAESETDKLSGCFTKTAGVLRIKDSLAVCARDEKNAALYLIDIDNFKSFNDTYGHLEGDSVIARVASTILGFFSDEGDVVLRLGGEEFVMLKAGISYDSASELTENVLREIAALDIPSGDYGAYDCVTVSAGVTHIFASEIKQGDNFVYSLINRSDKLLYDAKRAGKNRAIFNNELVYGKLLVSKRDDPEALDYDKD